MSITFILITILLVFCVLITIYLSAGFRHEHQARMELMQGHQRAFKIADKRLRHLERQIEDQDKLIAALWDQAYGYQAKDGEFFIQSWSKYPEGVYGIRPDWIVQVRDDGAKHELIRVSDYPWRA